MSETSGLASQQVQESRPIAIEVEDLGEGHRRATRASGPPMSESELNSTRQYLPRIAGDQSDGLSVYALYGHPEGSGHAGKDVSKHRQSHVGQHEKPFDGNPDYTGKRRFATDDGAHHPVADTGGSDNRKTGKNASGKKHGKKHGKSHEDLSGGQRLPNALPSFAAIADALQRDRDGGNGQPSGPVRIDEVDPGFGNNGNQRRHEAPPVNPEVLEMLADLDDRRSDYARLVAGRSRRAWMFKKEFRRRNIDEVRENYERQRDMLGGVIAHLYREAGASIDQIDEAAWAGAVQEHERLIAAIRTEKLLATGGRRYRRGERSASGVDIAVEDKGMRGPINAFYNFYARNSITMHDRNESLMRRVWAGTKNILAVGGVVGAGGLALGMTLGSMLPVATAATGALVANRITKAWMAARINRNANGSNLLVDQRTDELSDYMMGTISMRDGSNPIPNARTLNTGKLTNAVEAQMGHEVRGNRIRSAVMIGSALLGGAIAADVVHVSIPGLHLHEYFGGHSGNHPNYQHGHGHPGRPSHVHPRHHVTEAGHVNLHGAEYPWNWAANQFGANNATPELLHLVHKAHDAGVDVRINRLPNIGNLKHVFDISVNGNTDTQYVVDQLNKFR
jgi:hypothetical protein